MLKKSLISAALVALSSASAFAETDSFSIGAKGLYFMPQGEAKSNEAVIKVPKFTSGVATAEKSSFFFPGLQFSYAVSDMIRIGVSGYYGMGEFTQKFALAKSPSTWGKFFYNGLVTGASGAVVGAAGYAAYSRNFTKDQWGSYGKYALLGTAVGYLGGVVWYSDYFAKPSKAELVEVLSPKGVAFLTVEPKLYENDSFSLGATMGFGGTSWQHSWKVDGNAPKALPGNESASSFALNGMALINAAISLGDIANLTVSGGYAHFGNPKGFDYGSDSEGSKDKAQSDAKALNVQSSGFVLGLGIAKEF